VSDTLIGPLSLARRDRGLSSPDGAIAPGRARAVGVRRRSSPTAVARIVGGRRRGVARQVIDVRMQAGAGRSLTPGDVPIRVTHPSASWDGDGCDQRPRATRRLADRAVDPGGGSCSGARAARRPNVHRCTFEKVRIEEACLRDRRMSIRRSPVGVGSRFRVTPAGRMVGAAAARNSRRGLPFVRDVTRRLHAHAHRPVPDLHPRRLRHRR